MTKKKTAIAVKYDGKDAPHITASGHGKDADEIIQIAEAHDIPISEDPALTEILAAMPIGEAIPEPLFIAVAELLVWAYEISEKEPPVTME